MNDSRRLTFRVLRAQTGDRQALDDLLETIQDPLHRHVNDIVGHAPTADDVLQDVLVLIYRKLRWLREPDLFWPWCYRIATREALKRLKRERRWSAQLRDQEALDRLPSRNDDFALEPDALEEVRRLLHVLSPASRAVFSLHYLSEMSLQETAAVLGVPTGTAKSRLAYGLAVIRRKLEQTGGTDERSIDDE